MKLSIVTISYNDPGGLESTIESLVPLTRLNLCWEHLIVDSSPELNQNLLQALPKSWPLQHIVEKPRGIYEAMNTGIQATQGEYCWILNGGDRLKDEILLLELISRLDKHPNASMLWSAVDLWRDNQFLYAARPKSTYLNALLGSNRQCQQGILYRRKDLLELGLFDTSFRLAADYEHHWRYFIRKKVYIRDNRSLTLYDMSGSSMNFKKAFQEFANVHQKLAPELTFLLNICNILFRTSLHVKILIQQSILLMPFGKQLQEKLFYLRRNYFKN